MLFKIWNMKKREYLPGTFTLLALALSHQFPSNMEGHLVIVPAGCITAIIYFKNKPASFTTTNTYGGAKEIIEGAINTDQDFLSAEIRIGNVIVTTWWDTDIKPECQELVYVPEG